MLSKLFRCGSDDFDDTCKLCSGKQDEKISEGANAEQGQANKADGWSPKWY